MMAAAVHLISLHTRALSLSHHPLPPLYNHQHREINKSIQGRRATGLLKAMFGVLVLTLEEISWMSVELFWDYYLLCILRKAPTQS